MALEATEIVRLGHNLIGKVSRPTRLSTVGRKRKVPLGVNPIDSVGHDKAVLIDEPRLANIPPEDNIESIFGGDR